MKTAALCVFVPLALLPLVPRAAETAPPEPKLTGEITAKIYAFDYYDGVGADRTSYLERYRPQRGLSQDRRSGLYLDLDLDLRYQLDDRQTIALKRWGEGQYRHGGDLRWDSERFLVTADYNFFRRSTGGVDYLYSPNQVPGGTAAAYFFPAKTNTNSGYVAQFNDDSGESLYQVSRFGYGLGLKVKPGLLGEKTTLAVNYDGYLRYGRRFQTYALGGSDVQSSVAGDRSFVLQRWRGFARNVDENLNRLTWNLTAAPHDWFNFTYAGSWEDFNNRAHDYTHADIPLQAPYFYNPTANRTRPLGFVPDSGSTTHSARVSKTTALVDLSAGYTRSQLEQDSFTAPQQVFGFTKGQITTENAFLHLAGRVAPAVEVRGFVKYGRRDNDSTFPAVGLLNAAVSEQLGVRLNRLESTAYGLSAVLRPRGAAGSVTLGWKTEDKNRDLTFHNAGIVPSVSFYREDTEADEFYASWNAAPLPNLALNLTGSYVDADRTGFVTEPSAAYAIKARANYTAPNQIVLSAYYQLRDSENDNNSVTDKAVATPATHTQDLDRNVQSAGWSITAQPAKDAHLLLGLDWMRTETDLRFFESSRRRFEATTVFNLRDTTNSEVDTYLLTLGGDYRFSSRVLFTGSYSYVRTDGKLASGSIDTALGSIDDTLDSALHTVTVGLEYMLSDRRALRVTYRLDDYTDDAYPLLSGGVHSLMVGFTFRL